MQRTAIGLVMVLLLLFLSNGLGGCVLVAAGAGVGGAAYALGDTEEILSATPDEVADATAKAFKALELKTISKSASRLDGEIIARTSDDQKVAVRVKRQGDNASRASVRVGIFGDESRQRRILDEIKRRL